MNSDDLSLIIFLEDFDSISLDELFVSSPEREGTMVNLDSSAARRVRVNAEQLLETNDQLRRELLRRKVQAEQLRILASAVYVTGDGIAILTPERSGARIAYVNQAFCTIIRRAMEETIGASVEAFGVQEDDPAWLAMQQAMVMLQPFSFETVSLRGDGSQVDVELQFLPIRDSQSREVTHWVAFVRDISERRAQMLTLERQALHDTLTELPNRILLFDRLEQAIIVAGRERSRFALMLLDLDRFKEINDAFGHPAGDSLLQQVAKRLRHQVRASDTVARLGGDEFALLLPDVSDLSTAAALAQKVLRAFDAPFHIEERVVDVGASIGVVIWPDHGSDAALLIRRADSAMYRAKQEHSGFALHSATQVEPRPDQVTLATDLRRAIEDEQLVLHYQPKVHIRTGVTTRVEVLVRWNHPEVGLVAPSMFIPLAERTGLIKPMTDWILRRALEQCRAWNERGIPLHIAVNLSTRSLQEPFLPEKIQELLEATGVEPRFLKLEITESSILADPPQVTAVLALIQTLGVRLSIDDFGTGYSSLVHLRQLAVDEIKIDRSFVRDMCTDEGDAAVVRATIELAHSLGRQVVAEGVEDKATLDMLASLGCDMAQGYYFTPPLPAVELEQWLEKTRWGFEP